MYSCQEELKDPNQSLPQTSTTNVSLTEYTTAILGGIVTNDGGTPIISRGVCWNTTGSPTILNSKTSDGSGTGVFVCNLSGLNPGTKYYVRTYATNKEGTSYGNEVTFVTSKALLASLSTTELMSCTHTSACFHSEITSDNGAPVSSRGICWNTTGSPSITDKKTSDGSGTGVFVCTLTGLNPGTKYYVRTYATNQEGTSYGNEVTFTTSKAFLDNFSSIEIIYCSRTSVLLRSDIKSEYGAPVSLRGVCWNTTGSPTISDSRTFDGSGTGIFESTLTGLIPATTYFVRIYAMNGILLSYGITKTILTTSEPTSSEGIVFNPNLQYGSLSDIDGNTYKTIQIGTQTWMAENLKTTKLSDGTAIPIVTDNTIWDNMSTPALCWYNYDSNSYKEHYGALYNWFTVKTGKLCPSGWHIPHDSDWNNLQILLGGGSIAGGKMKETGNAHWVNPNVGATNETGFSAIPAGYKSFKRSYAPFEEIGYFCNLWSSAESDVIKFIYIDNSSPSFYDGDEYIGEYDGTPDPQLGFSVRCLKN